MAYATFSLEVQDSIAHLQLNRPEACNAMNRAFWREFPEAIRALDESARARVLVISSTGKHFSSGMDTEVFTQPDPSMFQGEPGRRSEALRRLVLQLQQCFSVLEQVRIPVLMAVQGGCIGGALDLVCAGDSRYCTEDAYFTIKETELGMTADLGTLQRLPRLIPDGLARELAYTARKMSAAEALQAGLVNRIFTDQKTMLTEVMAIAADIARQSPLAVTGTKQMLNYARDHSVADSLDYMATWQSGMFQPNDMMQALGSKVSGRAPVYEPLRAIVPAMQEPVSGDKTNKS